MLEHAPLLVFVLDSEDALAAFSHPAFDVAVREQIVCVAIAAVTRPLACTD